MKGEEKSTLRLKSIFMKKIVLIWVYFVVVVINTLSASEPLSKDAKVSILTCGAGFEFFEAFGHTALRICDSASGMDYVFNWGLFDYNTDNFYVKFAQGRLPYKLGIDTYKGFVAYYASDGRSMYEQELRLTDKEKNLLYETIIENYKPENRYYYYDFFEDNCATRVRDVVQNNLQDRQFHTSTMANSPLTFRQLFHPYTNNYLWWRFGIDIALGMRADKQIPIYKYMYLPDDLMNQFDTTVLIGDNKALAEPIQLILKEQCVHSTPTIFTPNMAFWLLLTGAALLTFLEIKRKFYAKIFDIVLFSAVFVVSILVFYLCFISDHNATKDNLNLLWANPLLLYVLVRLRRSSLVVLYILWACLAVLLFGFRSLPQSFNPAFFPILLTLMLRLTSIVSARRKQIAKRNPIH